MTAGTDEGFGSGFDVDDVDEVLFEEHDEEASVGPETEEAIVTDAIASGQTDPNELANLVFFERHPERDGAAIDRSEPDFEALRDEWLRIRDALVAPLLARAKAAAEEPAPTDDGLPSGISNVAGTASRQWTGQRRPEGWQKSVYGLVVHTMGGSLPCKATTAGVDPTQMAVDWYFKSHGTHYVCGWSGIAGGELLQVADEHLQAIGVGMGDQRTSVQSGDWESALPAVLVEKWRERWPNETDPMALLPGTQTANSAYVHVEMVAAVVPWCNGGKGLSGNVPPPMSDGLRYTTEQHDAIVELALDIADRHGWPGEWWTTSRLLGHEDLAPINRFDKGGGWDPGALRSEPWFDWSYVRDRIAERAAP